jgi:hypothetical protein
VRRLGRSGAKVAVALEPSVLRPTDSLTATITIGERIDRVRDARVQLGYVNTYSYRWAGRRDAALRHDDASLLTLGAVGTDAGSDRDTDDWVGVLDEALPVDGGVLEAGAHEIALRIPSWAPGSSQSIVRWVVRVSVDREGRPDVEVDETCTVLAPPPSPPPAELALERVMGDSSDIVVTTERPWVRAGEVLRGTVTLTAKGELPEADLAVALQRERASHPLERTPGNDLTLDGKRVQLDKHLTLAPGVPTTVPFAIDVPADSDPTSEAVHSSLTWFVQARVMYKGFNSHGVERVRRELVICTTD